MHLRYHYYIHCFYCNRVIHLGGPKEQRGSLIPCPQWKPGAKGYQPPPKHKSYKILKEKYNSEKFKEACIPVCHSKESDGLNAALAYIKDHVESPLIRPNFHGKNQEVQLLFHGEPGSGKSHLARAIATKLGISTFSVKSSHVLSKWSGDDVNTVESIVYIAREHQPCIVVFDDSENLLCSSGDDPIQRNIANEFKAQIRGFNASSQRILWIMCTNNLHLLDAAMRDRFKEGTFYIGPPTEQRYLSALDDMIKAGDPKYQFHLSEGCRHLMVQSILQQKEHSFRSLEGYLDSAAKLSSKAAIRAKCNCDPENLSARNPCKCECGNLDVTDEHMKDVLKMRASTQNHKRGLQSVVHDGSVAELTPLPIKKNLMPKPDIYNIISDPTKIIEFYKALRETGLFNDPITLEEAANKAKLCEGPGSAIVFSAFYHIFNAYQQKSDQLCVNIKPFSQSFPKTLGFGSKIHRTTQLQREMDKTMRPHTYRYSFICD